MLRYATGDPVPSGAARAGLAAGTAVGVAAGAHCLAHGGFDLAGAGWAFAVLLGPSWWLTRRERGWGAHALTQLAAQQAVHVALSPSDGGSGLVPADLMLYAHVLAAALTACWLRYGERRAWAAARQLVSGVLPLLPPPPSAAPLPVAPPAPAPRLPAWVLRHSLARRGPPATA